MIDLDKIHAALDKVSDNLHEHALERKELSARMAQLEQHIAARINHGGAVLPGTGPSVGAAALEQVREGGHPYMAQLMAGDAKGEAKMRLEGTSIRAALVGEGWGDSNDTTMPSDPRRGNIVPETLQPTSLLDALNHRPFDKDSSEYVQLTSTGSPSEQIQQGDAKAEMSFDGTLKRAEIITVAAWAPASRQVLADHGQLGPMMDMVLRGKCRIQLENLIVNGGQGSYGTSKMDGLLDQAVMMVPTFSVVQENQGDLVGHTITAMRANGFNPDLIVLNPWDWFRISTLKTGSTYEYIFGNPANPAQPVLWNGRVVTTSALAEYSGLVLDTAYIDVLDRMQPTVGISTSHEDYFTRNLVAILGELRAGLEVRDTAAVYEMDMSEYAASSV